MFNYNIKTLSLVLSITVCSFLLFSSCSAAISELDNLANLKYRRIVNTISSANNTKRVLTLAGNGEHHRLKPEEYGARNDVELFHKMALKSSEPATDKVTGHRYSEMYGGLMIPYIRTQHKAKKNVKFLEIGLGCKMFYGPGVSVKLWKKLFLETDEIWEADYDVECVKQSQKDNKLIGINVVTGDQSNFNDLKKWVETTGGNYDIVIDDGGHNEVLIRNSLSVLWPQVKPGGLYFIEDLQAAPIMGNHIKSWIDQLLLGKKSKDRLSEIPANVRNIMCQAEACVISKCEEGNNGGSTMCSPFH